MSDTQTLPSNVADIEEALRDVVDPELGINVVDLGLIYGITLDPGNHADCPGRAVDVWVDRDM